MGVESNSGTADARAAVTWPSTEVAARLIPLPNCSFMCQSFDSWIFELRDCFVAQSSPGWAILNVITQGRRVDATLLQIDLQSVFVSQDWPTLQTFSRCQCPRNTCFGIRLSGMRIMWLTHRSCPLSRKASMPITPQVFNTSVLGILTTDTNSVVDTVVDRWRYSELR